MSSRELMLRIPAAVRAEVEYRDGVCRLCGQSKHPIAHHIRYGGDDTGMGGRRLHVVENIILLGQGYEHQCHDRVHGSKMLWQPYLLALVNLPPNITGLMLRRWVNAGANPTEFGLELTSSTT